MISEDDDEGRPNHIGEFGNFGKDSGFKAGFAHREIN